MKFILYKEKIASPSDNIDVLNTPFDRHYYLDSFNGSHTFDELVRKEGHLKKTIQYPVLDLYQTFDVMGEFNKNPDDYEFVEEVDGGVKIKLITTGEEFFIDGPFVRTKAETRELLASRLITPYRGQFKDNFIDDWLSFVLKYKIKANVGSLIQIFIVNEEMLHDFNNLLCEKEQILPVRVDPGFFYNLYIEKTQPLTTINNIK